jgi:hypothetical protein
LDDLRALEVFRQHLEVLRLFLRGRLRERGSREQQQRCGDALAAYYE